MTTVTLKLHELEPLASEAVLLTIVVPIGKVLPEGGVEMTVGEPPQVSLADTLKKTVAGVEDVTTMADGQVMDTVQLVGMTVTVKLQLVLLPQLSLAVT